MKAYIVEWRMAVRICVTAEDEEDARSRASDVLDDMIGSEAGMYSAEFVPDPEDGEGRVVEGGDERSTTCS